MGPKTARTAVGPARTAVGPNTAWTAVGRIHRTYRLFANFLETVFSKQHVVFAIANTTVDPATRAGTVPEEGKIHRTYRLFANFLENVFFNNNFEKKGAGRYRTFPDPK